MFFVYVIKSRKDGTVYVGYTENLKRRFAEHNKGESTYTKNKRPFDLVYYEAYKSASDAKFRERNLKRFAQGYQALKKRLKNSLTDCGD